MYIHSLARGMNIEITLEDGKELFSTFDGNIDHMKFYVHCPEILKRIGELTNTQPTMKFLVGDTVYTFTAKILGKSNRVDALHDTVDFIVITPFREQPRRTNFRIKIALRVKIHSYVNDYKKLYSENYICEAVSDDVSKNGIRLWSDHYLELSADDMFTLEFSLRTNWTYFIPAKLVRHQRNTATRSYAYDYGFVFDFSAMPDRQEKLFLDILEYRIRMGG